MYRLPLWAVPFNTYLEYGAADQQTISMFFAPIASAVAPIPACIRPVAHPPHRENDRFGGACAFASCDKRPPIVSHHVHTSPVGGRNSSSEWITMLVVVICTPGALTI